LQGISLVVAAAVAKRSNKGGKSDYSSSLF